MPDAIGVWIYAEGPAADPRIDITATLLTIHRVLGVVGPLHERFERFRLGLDTDADQFVLFGGDLNKCLACLVAAVRNEREREFLAALLADAIGASGETLALEQLLGFGRIVLVIVQPREIEGPRCRRCVRQHLLAMPKEDLLDDQVHVQAVRESLSDCLVLKELLAAPQLVPTDIGVAIVGVLEELQ